MTKINRFRYFHADITNYVAIARLEQAITFILLFKRVIRIVCIKKSKQITVKYMLIIVFEQLSFTRWVCWIT